MKHRLIMITSLVLFSLVISCTILTKPFGYSDPRDGVPNERVLIEGAHIVSEGAYFRFWIMNNLTWALNVTINNADILLIPSKSSIDYNVVAPQVSVPYQKVTYIFKISNTWDGEESVYSEIDYPVLVLDSGFTQIFDLIAPILIAVGIVLTAIVFVMVVRRKRARSLHVEDTQRVFDEFIYLLLQFECCWAR